jgi:hypothetical protein
MDTIYTIHTQNKYKADNCFEQLQTMDMVPKSKMFKIYRNVSRAWMLLDMEMVECRRLKRITPKYTDLERNLNECVTVFEQWSIMAALTY